MHFTSLYTLYKAQHMSIFNQTDQRSTKEIRSKHSTLFLLQLCSTYAHRNDRTWLRHRTDDENLIIGASVFKMKLFSLSAQHDIHICNSSTIGSTFHLMARTAPLPHANCVTELAAESPSLLGCAYHPGLNSLQFL